MYIVKQRWGYDFCMGKSLEIFFNKSETFSETGLIIFQPELG